MAGAGCSPRPRSPRCCFSSACSSCPKAPAGWPRTARTTNARAMLATHRRQRLRRDRAVREIKATLVSEVDTVNFRELSRTRACARCSCWASALAVLQQWCGINVIFNYAKDIFAAAGYNISDILLNIVWTGLGQPDLHLRGAVHRGPGGTPSLMLFGLAGLTMIYVHLGACQVAGVKGVPMLLLVLAAIALLCHVPGAGGLGGDLGNLPQPHPRRGDVRGGVRPVDRLFHPHLLVPLTQREARRGWHLLALCRHLPLRVLSSSSSLPETKGKTLEVRSSGSWWTEPPQRELGRASVHASPNILWEAAQARATARTLG